MHGTFDGEEFGQAIVESIKAYVDRAINARCPALEAKILCLEPTLASRVSRVL